MSSWFWSSPPPQLTYGKPFDPSADVPVFPPFALLLTALAAIACRTLTNVRLRFLPKPLASLALRLALVAVALAFVVGVVVKGAADNLSAAGSGTAFTPVEGLATDGFYQFTRNPMYASLVFTATPALAVLLDSAWPVLLAPALWYYLDAVVITAEEQLLATAFPTAFAEYSKLTPRWLF